MCVTSQSQSRSRNRSARESARHRAKQADHLIYLEQLSCNTFSLKSETLAERRCMDV